MYVCMYFIPFQWLGLSRLALPRKEKKKTKRHNNHRSQSQQKYRQINTTQQIRCET